MRQIRTITSSTPFLALIIVVLADGVLSQLTLAKCFLTKGGWDMEGRTSMCKRSLITHLAVLADPQAEGVAIAGIVRVVPVDPTVLPAVLGYGGWDEEGKGCEDDGWVEAHLEVDVKACWRESQGRG
jgi:hypothetical protein